MDGVRSMTGFGRGVAGWEGGQVTAEVRTGNHRFAEVVVRLPREVGALEDRVRRMVLSEVRRGRAEVLIALDGSPWAVRTVHLDMPLAKAYHEALKELANALGVPVAVDLATVASLPGVLEIREEWADPEAAWPAVEEAVRQALAGALAMRRAEGRALAADVMRALEELGVAVERIAARATAVVDEHRRRLRRRVAELLGPDGRVDEARLTMEIALVAERSAIDEELARLRSHVEQCREALAVGGAVGRRLDFLAQEMNRELHTIGSKSGDVEIGRQVVAARSAVERLREQVQNVE